MKPPQDMTEQELRVAVAELCGWRRVEGSAVCWQRGVYIKTDNSIPPYSTSLDAMAEAEGTLTIEQQIDYEEYLTNIVHCIEGVKCSGFYAVISATAKQRAIAFIQTHRKDNV